MVSIARPTEKCSSSPSTLVGRRIPGGVDQEHVAQKPVAIGGAQPHVDRVARGAGSVVDDRALEAGEAIEQRRLADVGTADEREPEIGRRRGLSLGRGQALDDLVEQLLDAASVGRRDEHHRRDAQRMILAGHRFHPGAVHLVDRRDHRAPGLANQRDRLAVARAKAGPPVEHEDHDVGQRDRAQRPLGDALAKALASAQFEPAAIDDEKIAPAMLGLTDVEVTRGAGDRAYDRATAARDAVEQRRFAGIGASDQHYDRRALGQRGQRAGAAGVVRGGLHLRAPTPRSCAGCGSSPFPP